MRRLAIHSPVRQSGLTLLEIMVALSIGAFMLIGIISLLVSVSQTRMELARTSSKIENGRYALQILGDDIARAGFYGRYSIGNVTTPQIPDPCETTVADLGFAPPATMPTPLFGYAANVVKPACLTGITDNSEVIVVRRTATVPIEVAGFPSNNQPFLQVSTCDTEAGADRFRFSTVAGDFTLRRRDCIAANRAQLWSYVTRAYFLTECNDCAGTGDGIPTLRMAELVNGDIQITPLVEGIEDIHFQYGVDLDGDSAADCYVTNPSAAVSPAGCPAGWNTTNPAENWIDVTAVRVNVLVRALEPSAGWTDTRTYDLGRADRVGPFNDNFRRRVFSKVIVLPNVVGVRES